MCGKTLLLELLGHLVWRPLARRNTDAGGGLPDCRCVCPTLMIDEADKFIRSSRNPELIGILNASHHRRTAVVPRIRGRKLKMFSAWCTYAFTGIGRLDDQQQSRCISLMLKRALPQELSVLKLVEDGVSPELIDCGRKFARWAMDQRELPTIEVPSAVLYRDRDNWRPLLRIAELVGEEWPHRAKMAAISTSGVIRSAGDIVPLLADIRAAFGGLERITTEDLLANMLALTEPSIDWSIAYRGRPINHYFLRSKLAGVIDAPERERGWHCDDGKFRRGYRREHFRDSFARYLEAEAPSTDGSNVPPDTCSPPAIADDDHDPVPAAEQKSCGHSCHPSDPSDPDKTN